MNLVEIEADTRWSAPPWLCRAFMVVVSMPIFFALIYFFYPEVLSIIGMG